VANAVYVSVLVSQNMLYEPTPVIILYSKVIISVWSVVPFYCREDKISLGNWMERKLAHFYAYHNFSRPSSKSVHPARFLAPACKASGVC